MIFWPHEDGGLQWRSNHNRKKAGIASPDITTMEVIVDGYPALSDLNSPLQEDTMNKKFLTASTIILFLVLFNVGYVFHELLMGDWFRVQEAAIARENYIIPYIAIAFELSSEPV